MFEFGEIGVERSRDAVIKEYCSQKKWSLWKELEEHSCAKMKEVQEGIKATKKHVSIIPTIQLFKFLLDLVVSQKGI